MAEREPDQSKNSVTATSFSSFSSMKISKLEEQDTCGTTNLQIESLYDTKAFRAGKPLKEDINRQHDEQRPTIRPRLTLKGTYSGLLTVDTPARCLQSSCYNFSPYNDNFNEESICHTHIDLRDSSLEQSNVKEQRVAVIRPGNNAEQEEEEASMGDPDSVIKHPLQNSWAMWFFKNDKTRDWKDNLRVITTFDTVEDFWGLYNHTLPASKLQSGCDYSVFKAGIQPMWEDAQNKKGGRWLINLNKSQRQPHLDDLWLETLLCLIGEGFDEYSDDICGATVNIRTKGDKLGLWTRDASRNDATRKIGMKLKESLNVPPKIVIGFQAHSDTAGKAGSTVKNRFTV